MLDRIDPEVHELAFSYRDYEAEVIFIELCWQQYARTENSRVLDIACGTGEHLRQFSLRGYDCGGFDWDARMIEYARGGFAEQELPIKIWEADMRSFDVEGKFGLAINMLTTINLLVTNEDLLTHLQSVSRALEPGGIYFLEMFHPREYGFPPNIPTSAWEIQRDDLYLECDLQHEMEELDPIRQKQKSVMRIDITRGEKVDRYLLARTQRVYLYNELRALVECATDFELIKCFGSFNFERKLDNSRRSWRMIPVLRKKEEVKA